MKIFSAEQIRAWDRYTITHEPITSIDLMERAAQACVKELLTLFPEPSTLIFLTGPGNNGGDGLAMARICKEMGLDVSVFHPGPEGLSEDNRINLGRWTAQYGAPAALAGFTGKGLADSAILVDALFGTGQNRPPEGMHRDIIAKANASGAQLVSVDMPSGMIADGPSDIGSMVRASYTLSFGSMKLAFLLPSTGPFCGRVRILDIGLNREYANHTVTQYELTTMEDIRALVKPRPRFSHKGSFGTTLLVSGQAGMMGATILASRAAFRSGLGKLVCCVPALAVEIMQTAVPEAICLPDPDPGQITTCPELEGFDALGIGPGIGTSAATSEMLGQVMDRAKQPMVLDADALNIIARNQWQHKLRKGMVITPHPGEFRRLAGDFPDDLARLEACARLSTDREICVILKGHYTFLSTESGKRYFNSTGNPGMAKAGSGDVLTGVLMALLAQEYSLDAASRISVFLHGLAADMAAGQVGETGLMPSDTVDFISRAADRIWLNV